MSWRRFSLAAFVILGLAAMTVSMRASAGAVESKTRGRVERSQIQDAVFESDVQVQNRALGGHTEPAIAIGQRVAAIDEVDRDERASL